MARINKQSKCNDDYDVIVRELLQDIKEQHDEEEQRRINNKSIADFIINNLLVSPHCVNAYSSSCVSCPYRYDCSCCDCNVDVVVLSCVVS